MRTTIRFRPATIARPTCAQVLAAALVALTFLLQPAANAAEPPDDAVWKALQAGGNVALIRHAVTTPGIGDPGGMRLDDCGTQRNLSDEGRRHAREIGQAFRARSIAVARVLSSPWCRCLETARLAFGGAEPQAALGNLFGRADQAGWQVDAMRTLVAGHRGPENLVLVSHGSTILALTGVSPAPGEIVVVVPDPASGMRVVGRVIAHLR